MLHQTQAIVFQVIKYSESSIIAKIYTEDFGLQTYMVKGVRSKGSKTKMALFETLNLLEIVVYHKPNKTINMLREVRSAHAYQDIPMNMVKRGFVFFLSELLVKSIREEATNPSMFKWLTNAFTWLDLSESDYINFHLIFMMQLSRFLGFHPKKSGLNDMYFDLKEGLFCPATPNHSNYLEKEITMKMMDLYHASFENAASLQLTNDERHRLLDVMVAYYKQQLPGFTEMKSLEVLRMVF